MNTLIWLFQAQGIPLPEDDDVISSPVIVVTEESGIPLSNSDVISDLPSNEPKDSPSDNDDVDNHQGNHETEKPNRKISFALNEKAVLWLVENKMTQISSKLWWTTLRH